MWVDIATIRAIRGKVKKTAPVRCQAIYKGKVVATLQQVSDDRRPCTKHIVDFTQRIVVQQLADQILVLHEQS